VIDFVVETEIARAPAEVFAYVTDPTKLASWQTNTVSAVPEQDGPIKLGSRIREVHRMPGGRAMNSLVDVVEFEQDRVFGMRIVEGPPIHGRITFEPAEGGTRFRFRVYGDPPGAMRLFEPLLARMLRRNFTAYCARLKQVLEGTSGDRS
jgi:uncharacterized protein YndB with AHSA1/START domain